MSEHQHDEAAEDIGDYVENAGRVHNQDQADQSHDGCRNRRICRLLVLHPDRKDERAEGKHQNDTVKYYGYD